MPEGPGVYVVYRPSTAAPPFLAANPGGRFKGKDPTVAVEVLAREWVAGSRVLYIGKADRLRRRLKEYARFGAGEPLTHWGGRYIWQLAEADDLLVAWRGLDAAAGEMVARDGERDLLSRFAEQHGGRRPFANLTG